MASTLLKQVLLSSAGAGILKLKVCLGSLGKKPKGPHLHTSKKWWVVKGSLLCKSSVMLSTKVLWVPKCLCQAEEEAWFVCARAGVALCVCALYRSVS